MNSIVPKTNRADRLNENLALFRVDDPGDLADAAFDICFSIYD